MTTLYIIGNGFDLTHHLPTKYNPDLFNELVKLDVDVANAISELYFQNNVHYWQNFENLIGKVDEHLINDLRNNIENNIQAFQDEKDTEIYYFGPEDEKYGDDYSAVDNALNSASQAHVDIERALESTPLLQIDKIKSALNEGFENMISQANDMNTKKPERLFNKFDRINDKFITFNYTNTLEQVYGIPKNNILHIHGDLDLPAWGNQDININELQNDFFHEIDYSNHQDDFDLEHAKPDEIAAYNASRRGEDAAFPSNYDDYLSELNEPDSLLDEVVSDLNTLNSSMIKTLKIEELEQWIDSNTAQKEIQSVSVIGHSLGTVDMPYFNLLADKFNNKKWIVSFHGKEDPVFKNESALNGHLISGNQLCFYSL
ncbi:hypothetical protein PB1E_1975 [Leuconostoc gelidum subsp. gasicomitatum]|nr:hypothetical protein PB1E_1975 [Leuconostoc gasicomitatum]